MGQGAVLPQTHFLNAPPLFISTLQLSPLYRQGNFQKVELVFEQNCLNLGSCILIITVFHIYSTIYPFLRFRAFLISNHYKIGE